MTRQTLFSLILALSFILPGCTTSPISVLPAVGDRFGADKVDCVYSRTGSKYSLKCTIEDEGEV